MQKLPLEGGGDTLENLNTQSSNTSLEQTPQPTTKPKEKSGFTFGIEANFGSSQISQYSILSMVLVRETTYGLDSFAFDGGITFGYQHYFGESQKFGIGTSVYLGVGNPIEGKFGMGLENFPIDLAFYQLNTSYIPLKMGFEVNFLWDFWESGEHTLGLIAGAMYRFAYLFAKDGEIIAQDNVDGTSVSLGSTKISNQMIHTFAPQIGLAYNYANHQFSLKYRFGGILASLSDTLNDNIVIMGDNIGVVKTQIKTSDYLSIGYSYRF